VKGTSWLSDTTTTDAAPSARNEMHFLLYPVGGRRQALNEELEATNPSMTFT